MFLSCLLSDIKYRVSPPLIVCEYIVHTYYYRSILLTYYCIFPVDFAFIKDVQIYNVCRPIINSLLYLYTQYKSARVTDVSCNAMQV